MQYDTFSENQKDKAIVSVINCKHAIMLNVRARFLPFSRLLHTFVHVIQLFYLTPNHKIHFKFN